MSNPDEQTIWRHAVHGATSKIIISPAPVFEFSRLTMPGGVKRAKGAKRTRPNILVTGTPGTGKTTLARAVEESVPGMARYSVGEVATQKGQ